VERELKTNFDDITVEIIEGRKGVFDVEVDDVLIFSRKRLKEHAGRFPKEGEVTGLIKEKFL